MKIPIILDQNKDMDHLSTDYRTLPLKHSKAILWYTLIASTQDSAINYSTTVIVSNSG